jgi:glucose/mannose-6-phosphate isomerase
MSIDWKKLGAEHDPAGMYDLVEGFPAQMQAARAIGAEFAPGIQRSEARQVVVCGMGGSAIGGDMARSFLGSRLAAPLLSVRDYEAPAYLRDGSFVVLSSYSGNTGETLSAFECLHGGASTFVTVTSGGQMEERCRARDIPVCNIPGGMPPRSAIGYSLFPSLAILRAAAMASFDDAELDEAQELVTKRCSEYSMDSPDNRAMQIAQALHGKLPLVYAGPGLYEAVARRWACQVNENSKQLAHWAVFTELCHNEIVGYEALPELRQNTVVISLEDEDDHDLTKRQTDVAIGIMEPLCAEVIRIREGGGRMSRMLGAMILGDFVSVYLAYLNGVDPTPVKNIDRLKSQLS